MKVQVLLRKDNTLTRFSVETIQAVNPLTISRRQPAAGLKKRNRNRRKEYLNVLRNQPIENIGNFELDVDEALFSELFTEIKALFNFVNTIERELQFQLHSNKNQFVDLSCMITLNLCKKRSLNFNTRCDFGLRLSLTGSKRIIN